MSMEGVLETSFVECGVCVNSFKALLEDKLIHVLCPFNETNKHSVIVMDNASIHHVQEVVELVEGLGVLVYFLPPYSPDYNPIEELFSKLKSVLKANEYTCEDFKTQLLMAFSSISVQDCQNWIQHAGYTLHH